MVGESDPAPEPLFRANKRRKIIRKRTSPEEAEDAAATAPSNADAVADEDDERAISTPIRPTKGVSSRKYGISFTSSGKEGMQEPQRDEEMAVVQMHPSREQQMAQSDRFVKPTGKVTVADDRHMVAYIDSKLAELRSATATPVDTTIRSTTTLSDRPQREAEGDHPGNNLPSQPGSASKTNPQIPTASTPAGAPSVSDRSKQSKQPPMRPRRPPPTRDASHLARDSLVDQILRESAVPLYSHTTPSHPLPASADEEGVDNDEAAANAFKAEFLASAEQHRRRKPPPPPPQKGVVPASTGPKLGGSRSQRERMKAAEEAAGKGGAGGKR